MGREAIATAAKVTPAGPVPAVPAQLRAIALATLAMAAMSVVRDIADAAEAVQRPLPAEQEIGRRFALSPDQLPPPFATRPVNNAPTVVPFTGQTPRVAEGFTVALVARLQHPRRLLVLPNGDIIVAQQRLGVVSLIRDAPRGKPAQVTRIAQGFNLPYGLAWRDGEILVADQAGIWRIPHPLSAEREGASARQGSARGMPQRLITRRGVFGLVAGHANRPLAIDPRSGALFVGVGSIANVDVEPAVKATIQRFAPDGREQSTYVSGTRNPCGLAVDPETGALWAVVQERDGLGDRVPPDYLLRLEEGAFYGWPYAYTGQHPQPGLAARAPEKVRASQPPDLLFEAHSSALDLVFYSATQFPAEYRGDAFVALRGSWNRGEPTGYKVVRVKFRDGRPAGYYENFATGFRVSGHERARVWGRPAALAVARDGALLVADDTAGTIWRISYSGPHPNPADQGGFR